MKEQNIKWYSPILGQETEMLIFGEKGLPIILYPTSMGRFYQNKDFKLIEAVSWFINQGLVKIYCPDSIDTLSWYNKNVHPAQRVLNHIKYDSMIREEVVTRAQSETGSSRVAHAGCSFGGYHALNFGFRYPHLTSFIFSMSGAFDIKPQLDGYYDDNVYYNNPPDFIPSLNDDNMYRMGIVLGTSEHDGCLPQNIKMAEILSHKGIPHWLDNRPNAVHDWPVWREMFPHYLSLIDYSAYEPVLKLELNQVG